MELKDQLHQIYSTVKNYPELVKELIGLGILSYTVEVSTGIILYRLADGATFLHPSELDVPRNIAIDFNESLAIKAVRDNQQGKSDYAGFMNDIAAAGVRMYEAVLNGVDKRVIYIGNGGVYEENIPTA